MAVDSIARCLALSAKGGSGTTDYNNLTNKPKIENHELVGNKTAHDLELLKELPNGNNDTFLHKNASTGNMEWVEIKEVPVVSASDKDRYLHTNTTSGNLEWKEVNYEDKDNKKTAIDDTTKASDVFYPTTKAVYEYHDAEKLDADLKGVANGVAELDENGKVPTSQLPSYVDDVIEGYYYNSKFYKDAAHTEEITPESGKIYVDLTENKTYRWSGTVYVEISASLTLGETSTTAYRGDRGKEAYDHSKLVTGNPHDVRFEQLADVPNKEANKFLKVNSDATAVAWAEVKEVPAVGTEDKDKYLHTNTSSGETEWVTVNYEDKNNKVTAFQATPDDTHYPSEKLVKDKLDEKQDNLPTVVNDRYLHTNASTGDLEWASVVIPTEQKENYTIAASGWSGKTYSFETPYPVASWNIDIELAPTATVAQYTEYGKAIITGNKDTNVITALGTKPTIDIPIIVTKRAK